MTDLESKLPLPKFLKIMTNNGIPVAKAMAITGKIYREYNTPSQLSELTDNKLVAIGLTDKEDRKSALASFRKAGYTYKGKAVTKKETIAGTIASSPTIGPSKLTDDCTTAQIAVRSWYSRFLTHPKDKPFPFKRKRKHSSDKNEFLFDGQEVSGSLEFVEVLDEDVLCKKSSVINRAPIMMAWSMVVAERLGFKRDEALSVASVYTEMNAISKGISLGVFTEGKDKGMEAALKGSQPYVDIMGRRVPLYRTQEGQWRALLSGTPILPGAAFSYISRSLKQTSPYIIGALRLLALSYPPKVLNNRGWSLYADFRPQTDGWGKRSEVKCSTILNLRPSDALPSPGNPAMIDLEIVKQVIHVEDNSLRSELSAQHDEPQAKKARTMTLEEYEATLDNDPTFDDVNLDISSGPYNNT